jgi:hypothetical protein
MPIKLTPPAPARNVLPSPGFLRRFKRAAPVIFLSHASEDRKEVEVLAELLESKGFRPWLDVSPHALRAGDEWDHRIRNVIRESDFAIVCVSEFIAQEDRYVADEIRWILETAAKFKYEGFLIPVKLRPCELPANLAPFQCLNLFDSGADDLVRLIYSTYQMPSPAQLVELGASATLRLFRGPFAVPVLAAGVFTWKVRLHPLLSGYSWPVLFITPIVFALTFMFAFLWAQLYKRPNNWGGGLRCDVFYDAVAWTVMAVSGGVSLLRYLLIIFLFVVTVPIMTTIISGAVEGISLFQNYYRRDRQTYREGAFATALVAYLMMIWLLSRIFPRVF